MDHRRAAIVWQGRETYRPLRHRIEHRIYSDLQIRHRSREENETERQAAILDFWGFFSDPDRHSNKAKNPASPISKAKKRSDSRKFGAEILEKGARWRKEFQEVQLFNETLRREETIRHQVCVPELRPPQKIVEGRIRCRPSDRISVVVDKLYHSDGIRVLIRMQNCETREEKYFRRSESRDDDVVYNLVHGAKSAIGDSMGHTSLPDTKGKLEDIVKNFPKDPENDQDKALEILTEQTRKWLQQAESPPTTLEPSTPSGPGKENAMSNETDQDGLQEAYQVKAPVTSFSSSTPPRVSPEQASKIKASIPVKEPKEIPQIPVQAPLKQHEATSWPIHGCPCDLALAKPLNLEAAKGVDWSAMASRRSPCEGPKGYSIKPKPLLSVSTTVKPLPTPKEVIADLYRISAGCPGLKEPVCCLKPLHNQKGKIACKSPPSTKSVSLMKRI